MATSPEAAHDSASEKDARIAALVKDLDSLRLSKFHLAKTLEQAQRELERLRVTVGTLQTQDEQAGEFVANSVIRQLHEGNLPHAAHADASVRTSSSQASKYDLLCMLKSKLIKVAKELSDPTVNDFSPAPQVCSAKHSRRVHSGGDVHAAGERSEHAAHVPAGTYSLLHSGSMLPLAATAPAPRNLSASPRSGPRSRTISLTKLAQHPSPHGKPVSLVSVDTLSPSKRSPTTAVMSSSFLLDSTQHPRSVCSSSHVQTASVGSSLLKIKESLKSATQDASREELDSTTTPSISPTPDTPAMENRDRDELLRENAALRAALGAALHEKKTLIGVCASASKALESELFHIANLVDRADRSRTRADSIYREVAESVTGDEYCTEAMLNSARRSSRTGSLRAPAVSSAAGNEGSGHFDGDADEYVSDALSDPGPGLSGLHPRRRGIPPLTKKMLREHTARVLGGSMKEAPSPPRHS